MTLTTRESVETNLLHRKLTLKVDGQPMRVGTWNQCMRTAVKFGDKNWEIVEKVKGIGEKIITKHFSLLSSNPSFLGTKETKRECDED